MRPAILTSRFAALILSFLTSILPQASRALDLKEGWTFSRGDDPSWSSEKPQGGDWGPIQVGVAWQASGHKDYNGWGWYRIRIRPPASWNRDAVFKKAGFLVLDLGKVDDCDQTFLNGTEIGRGGSFPPDYKTAYNVRRLYHIPAPLLRWSQDNILAVRVWDGGGAGGITPLPVSLNLPGIQDFVKAEIGLGRGDGIFPGDKPLPLELHVENSFYKNLKGRIHCRIRRDSGEDLGEISRKILILQGASFDFKSSFQPPAPGFYRVSFTLELNQGLKLERSMILGYDPEALKTALTREPDFQAYWDQARQELKTVNPEFQVESQVDLSKGDKNVSLITMKSLGGARVRAWYSVPRKGRGPWPAVLQVQGFSSTMQADQGLQDFAVLSLNIRGHGNSKDDVNPGFPGYLSSGLNDPKTYIYRGSYMDCLRAVDFLVSRKEVDKERIAVEGGSQGGALTFATAALDSRIKVCAPDVPFLSDFRNYAKVAGWPSNEFMDFAKAHPDQGEDGVYRVLSYIDIMNLAPWIRCPLLMSVGLQDPTCPPRINFAAYNQVTSAKEYRVYPHGDHGGGGGDHWALKYAWIREHFGMPKP